MKYKFIKVMLTLTFGLVILKNAKAGFPIGNGRWLLVPTYTHYTASSYWDNNGATKNFSGNGLYTSNYMGLYGGFGIGREVDFLFNIPYISQSFTANGVDVEPSLQTTGDLMIGLRYFINNYDHYKHLSLQGSLLIPTYPNIEGTTLLPGFASVGGEIKLGLAGINQESMKNSYYDLEVGIRSYFNAGGPTQFFANATLGVPLDEHNDWTMAGTLNGIWSSSATGFVEPKGLYINRDFNYMRATLGLGRRISRNFTIWASIFKDISGRSIGQGSGFTLHGVIKF